MNTPDFELDSRLAHDTLLVCHAPLCRIGLMNDARFPWLILVPRLPDVREWTALNGAQQTQLQTEINASAKALQQIYPHGEKLNIAALGNVIPQLHIHVVLRHQQDAAWPNPVWGFGQRILYSDTQAQKNLASLHSALNDL
jgi:diadenosine tetraphosphate (Ap4A) HIT family hydrolase